MVSLHQLRLSSGLAGMTWEDPTPKHTEWTTAYKRRSIIVTVPINTKAIIVASDLNVLPEWWPAEMTTQAKANWGEKILIALAARKAGQILRGQKPSP